MVIEKNGEFGDGGDANPTAKNVPAENNSAVDEPDTAGNDEENVPLMEPADSRNISPKKYSATSPAHAINNTREVEVSAELLNRPANIFGSAVVPQKTMPVRSTRPEHIFKQQQQQHKEEASIQIFPDHTSLKNNNNNSQRIEENACSLTALCGPNPKKVSIVVALVLSVWASIVLAVNVHKKVINLETQLSDMSSKMADLEGYYLEMQESNSEEISFLRNNILKLLDKDRKKSPVASRPEESVEVVKKVIKSGRKKGNETKHGSCKTEGGQACVFPFEYKDLKHDGCVQQWTDPKPWCATKVDKDGKHVDWDRCDPACKMSVQDIDAWNF